MLHSQFVFSSSCFGLMHQLYSLRRSKFITLQRVSFQALMSHSLHVKLNITQLPVYRFVVKRENIATKIW